MTENKKEIVPGLTSADVKEIADQIFNRTDGNHPKFNKSENSFVDILQNAKPDFSASPVFVRKVIL